MVLNKFTGSTKMDGTEQSLFKIVGTTMKHFAAYVYLKALQAGESIRLRVYNKVDDVSHWKFDGDVTDSVSTNNGTVTNISSWVSQWKFDGDVLDSVGSNNGTITYNTNLKRLYKFESNLNDSTTAAANGTLGAGSATYVTGKEGKAFSFTGTEYITASDTGLQTANGAWSVTGWIYPTSFASNRYIYSYGSNVANQAITISTNTLGKIVIGNVTGALLTSTLALQLNTWYHIEVTYNGTTLTIYINSVSDSTATPAALNITLAGASGQHIGANIDNTSPFVGYVDELRNYNIALTQAQVSALYMNGKFAQSHTFDGDNTNGEYITTNAKPGSIFTWSYWVKTPSFIGNQIILAHVYGTNEFLSFIDTGGHLVFDITGQPAILTSTGTITTNTWNHIVFVYDGTKIQIYINGVFDSQVNYTLTGAEASTTLIGSRAGVASTLGGQLDELRIYSSALTASQVSGLYNYTGSNYVTPLPVGNALSLDGSSYVTVNNETPYHWERTQAFSMSYWFKSTSIVAQSTIYYKFSGGAGHLFILNASGYPQLIIRNTPTTNDLNVQTNTNVQDGSWHNVIVTYDGSSNASNVKFYIDGVLKTTTVNSNTLSATVVNTIAPVIGAQTGGGNPYTGLIDEFQIFNYVVSSAEINAINAGRFANTHNIGYWKFDGDLTDSSGQGSIGSPTGTMTYVTGSLSGSYNVPNTHFNFDGSEYVDIGNVSNLSFEWTQPFSVSCWLRTTYNSYQFIIAKFQGVNSGWLVGQQGNNFFFQLANQNNVNDFTTNSTGLINDGLWHHCIVTYDGSGNASNVKFYIDGVQSSTGIGRNNLTKSIVNTAHVVIGALDTTPTNPWVGEIEDLRVYNRILSSAEVSDLYTYPDSAMKSLVYDKTYSGPVSDTKFDVFLPSNQLMITATQTGGTNRIVSWEREESTG